MVKEKLTIQDIFSAILIDLSSGFLTVDKRYTNKQELKVTTYNGPAGLKVKLSDNKVLVKNYEDLDYKEVTPIEFFNLIPKEVNNYFS